jgi:arabinofuranosyltransferase
VQPSPATDERTGPSAPRRWPPVATALAVGLATLAAAWTGDDAMVTFRTVENLVAGDGMTWNVAERTQTATHPLWVLALAAARLCTGELFLTAIALGVLCTTAAAALVARGAAHGPAVAFVAAAMLGSHAFVEYGTCGLENPLVYLLLALFAREWFDGAAGPRRLLRLGLLAALLVLARQDLVLLLAPCMLAALRGCRARAAVVALLPGTALLAAWYAFALVYYGTVIPTPGHGKVLAVGVPWSALFAQGCRYVADLVLRDPATAIAMATAVALALASRTTRHVLPALGIALQLAYTLRVGGDFMAGRFFTPAFLFAVGVLARLLPARGALLLALVVVLTPLAAGLPPWLRPAPAPAEAAMRHGIVDERSYYAAAFGLWSPSRDWPAPGAISARFRAEGRQRPLVDLAATVGHRGLLAGPLVHMVEPWICDPLLVRLPVADPGRWRIGHFTRRIPEGYLETLASGENRIRHAALAQYWEALRTVLRAPVLDGVRLATWWQFVRGDYDALLARYVAEEYRTPPRVDVDAASLGGAVPDGTHWFDADCVVVREGGLRVRFPAPVHAARIRVQADGGGRGTARLLRGEDALAVVPFELPSQLLAGARPLRIDVPAAAAGYDALELRLDTVGDPSITVLERFAVLSVQVE